MEAKRLHYDLLGVLFTASVSLGMAGPLKVDIDNPRYFTDDSGKAVYLAGMHTWNNLVDIGPSDPPAPFNYGASGF